MASPRLSGFRSDHLLRETQEPVYWLDRSLRAAWVNPAWEALTGYSGREFFDMARGAMGAEGVNAVAELVAALQAPPEAREGLPASHLTTVTSRSGQRTTHRVDFWPFRDHGGSQIGILARIRSADETSREKPPIDPGLHDELILLRQRLHRTYGLDRIVGRGAAHERLMAQIKLAASTDCPVLLVGEPGTGKRWVAATIHQLGGHPREREGICGFGVEALMPDELENALLDLLEPAKRSSDRRDLMQGGSAVKEPRGIGAVSLGDILQLPRDIQARLLRFLEDENEHRIRLFATTSGDPDAAHASGQIRGDLYYALTTLVIRLSPLRERRDEIPLLAQDLLEWANQSEGPHRSGFTDEAIEVLLAYDWPGNLEELDRVVRYARSQGEGALISAAELPVGIKGNLGAAYLPPTTPATIRPLDELLTEIERRLIESALAKARRNKTRAADLLGISRPRLYRRMKELNLEDESDDEDDAGTTASG